MHRLSFWDMLNTVKTLKIGTPRLTTVVVLNIKQYIMKRIHVGISNIIYSEQSLFIYDVSAFIKIMKFVRVLKLFSRHGITEIHLNLEKIA